MKIGMLITMMFSALLLGAANPLASEWRAVDQALDKQQPRTAVAELEKIEAKAAEEKLWSDLAAAIMRRMQLEYGYTEESALKKEGREGLVAKFVEKVEASPAEVRPMLRLVVAHGYLTMSLSMRYWHANRTKLENSASTNQPPWSAERLRPSLRELMAKILADAPVLQKEKPSDWKRLVNWGDEYGDEIMPTLFDFAVNDMVNLLGRGNLIDHDANGAPTGLAADLLGALDARIAFHAAGGNPHALVHAKLAKIDFLDAATQGRPKEKRTKRIAALEALTKEYFDTTWMSGMAAEKLGVLREHDLNADLVQLHDWYLGFAKRWPNTPGGEACRARADLLETPSFSAQTERNWCSPVPDIGVSYKNLTNATFRLVKLDLDDLVEHDDLDLSPSNYEKYLKKYFGRKTVKEWTVALPPHPDYREYEYSFPAPSDLPKGHYALFATGGDRFDVDREEVKPALVKFITVTGLAIVTRDNGPGLSGYLFDAEQGTPAAGAQIELWARDRRQYKLFEKTKTAADGAFAFGGEHSRWGCYLRAVKDGDEAISRQVNVREKEFDSKPLLDHVDLVTDRAIYRPGQVVKFKGFAFHCDAGQNDYRVIADTRVFVTFCDPNGKQVAQLALMSNAFGSFSGEFIAPRDLLTGSYTLRGELRTPRLATTTARVQVEEYKRPKFTVKLNATKDEKLGAETTVTGVATTYTGLPVPGAEVEWRVTRSAVYPRWWFWTPQDDDDPVFASGKAKTDEKGEFRFTFTPTAPDNVDLDGDPSFRFQLNVNVTDGAGESHAASGGFEVGMVPWRAELYLKDGDGWQTPAKPMAVKSSLRTLNGEPVANVKGTVKVYSLKGPDHVVRRDARFENFAWGGGIRQATPVQLSDPTTWPNGEMVGEFTLATNEKGAAEIEGAKLAPGMYRAEYLVTAPNGKIVKDRCTWRVIDPASTVHPVKEPVYAKVEHSTVPVGGIARFYWGTGYDRAYCRVTVRQGGKTLLEEVRRESMFCLDLPIQSDMVGQLAIETMFVRENRLMTERAYVNVPRPDCHLEITRSHFTSKLLPGAKETWSFTVNGTDTTGLRSGVEMLAFMYDSSLDAFMPHSVGLPFYRYIGRESGYCSWALHNEIRGMGYWQGHWPYKYHRQVYNLPGWRSSPDALFSVGYGDFRARMVGGTRGGAVRKMAARATMNAVADGMVEECAAVPMAAAAPMEEKAEAPMAALGGKARKRKESETGGSRSRATAPEVAPRKNLAETAFFLPHLTSDEKGAVTFTFTVPEALTGWKFTALAHDAKLRSGNLTDDSIVTVKPLMVEPVAPRFVREGDRFLFPVKVTNTEDTPQSVAAALEFFDAESGEPAKFTATGGGVVALGPHETKTVEFAVEIPDGCGCLRYVAKAKSKEFTDGEEGFLPILSKRVEVRESLPLQIKKGGVKTAKFKELAASGESKTLRHAGLAVQVVSDPTWYAFLALPYLMEYPHECCEQVFSRFYANALAQHIARSRPAYREVFEAWEQLDAKALKSPLELNEDLKQIALDATPWVNEAADETKAKRHIGELFGSARLESEQRRAVEKLERNFNGGDELWPWFPGGPGSAWVTMHILTGYARLDRILNGPTREGRAPARPPCLLQKPSQLQRARRGLDAEMVKIIDERLAMIKKFGGKFYLSSLELRWLYLQSFDGGTSKHTPMLMKHLRKEWVDFGITGQSIGAIVLMRAGEEKLARTIVKSLKERAVRSEEFGLYWKRSPFFDCSLFAAPVCDQALAMEAFLEITPEDRDAYEDARLWLLEQKRTQNWSTTVSTVDAVYAILLGDGGKARVSAKNEDVVVVRLGGEELPREGVEAGTGFYEHRFDPAKITAKLGEIELERKEDKLGWASLNWTYLEDATKVHPFEQSGLRLTKTYFKKTLVEGKVRLVALGGGEPLRPGDELVSRLTIDSDRVYEYAHLRDERPASAEPVDVLSRYRWQDGLGFYQSTRDTATHYYFDRLSKGNFVLETSFRVRQQGTFSSGLASLQCMYAPEFGAHSNASVIEVRK